MKHSTLLSNGSALASDDQGSIRDWDLAVRPDREAHITGICLDSHHLELRTRLTCLLITAAVAGWNVWYPICYLVFWFVCFSCLHVTATVENRLKSHNCINQLQCNFATMQRRAVYCPTVPVVWWVPYKPLAQKENRSSVMYLAYFFR